MEDETVIENPTIGNIEDDDLQIGFDFAQVRFCFLSNLKINKGTGRSFTARTKGSKVLRKIDGYSKIALYLHERSKSTGKIKKCIVVGKPLRLARDWAPEKLQ